MTRWAKDVSPANVWAEHPRPQLVRKRWTNLNGLWDYAIEGESKEWKGERVENARDDLLLRRNAEFPTKWDGEVLVPFAVESALSGVGKFVRPNQLLWYRRFFNVPPGWKNDRVVLHFEAVDWHAVVWVNRKRVAENRGGYVPFQADVTEALLPDSRQELMIAVWDPTNAGDQAVGKQSLPEMRQGYRYTPTTGIWQTVWMEPVPRDHIEKVRITPDVDRGEVRIAVASTSTAPVRVSIRDGSREVAHGSGVPGTEFRVRVPNPKLWSPADPFLYSLEATLGADRISSYFGMRKIAIQPDARGVPRYFLNNQPLAFQFGPLDQGYWPDGVLTPPSDKAAEFDVNYLKSIGCNMVRVHVKVHPDRWYYHCDRLGLLVWQDFVCTRKFEAKITPSSATQWESEQKRAIDSRRNHPSIIQWVVFNEGWGQYDTERLTRWTQSYDPERTVTAASGWADVPGVGNVRDIHDYSFFPSIPPVRLEKPRAIVIGEYGGFDVGVAGHLWHKDQVVKPTSGGDADGGRQKYRDGRQWLESYEPWLRAWRHLIGEYGLNAGVYTQITDVEHEPNGWLTYDREVSKIPIVELRRLHDSLYRPAAPLVAVDKANGAARAWRWSPAGAPEWSGISFDDSTWKESTGPFAGARKEIYLRRVATLDRVPRWPALITRQSSGEAEIYLNGKRIVTSNNRGTRETPGITVIPVGPDAAGVLKSGKNVISVRLRFQSEEADWDLEIVELPSERERP